MRYKTILARTFPACVAVLFVVGGCSLSKSSSGASKSSSGASKSLSSPSRWSSGSSSAEEGDRYQDEVADFTAAFVRSSEEGELDMDSFRRGIGEIAEKVGVVNWESQSDTYIGVGKGLKKAGVKEAEYENLKKELTGSDYGKMQDVERGYRPKEEE